MNPTQANNWNVIHICITHYKYIYKNETSRKSIFLLYSSTCKEDFKFVLFLTCNLIRCSPLWCKRTKLLTLCNTSKRSIKVPPTLLLKNQRRKMKHVDVVVGDAIWKSTFIRRCCEQDDKLLTLQPATSQVECLIGRAAIENSFRYSLQISFFFLMKM